MIRPTSWFQFAVGVIWLLSAVAHFVDRNDGFGLFGRYTWLMWALGSIIFFYNAYRTPPPPPAD